MSTEPRHRSRRWCSTPCCATLTPTRHCAVRCGRALSRSLTRATGSCSAAGRPSTAGCTRALFPFALASRLSAPPPRTWTPCASRSSSAALTAASEATCAPVHRLSQRRHMRFSLSSSPSAAAWTSSPRKHLSQQSAKPPLLPLATCAGAGGTPNPQIHVDGEEERLYESEQLCAAAVSHASPNVIDATVLAALRLEAMLGADTN
eukprot:2395539-Rhodomonas_salina.3